MIRICHNFGVEMKQYGSCPGSDGDAPISCRDNCPYMEIINDMNKLKTITFTGIDEKTDVDALKAIKEEYPIVEFGVLMSRNWMTNGNRYPNPETISRFLDQGLNLSAHLCGGIAKSAFAGDFSKVIEKYPVFSHPDFKRVQLNVSPYEDIFETAAHLDEPLEKEIIIQQKSPTLKYSQAFNRFSSLNENLNVTMLVDPSGGRGKDEGLDLIATDHKIGYAGGINIGNVEDKLVMLLNTETIGDFWIDMESGVRTDDWFDVEKVRKILEVCNRIIK